MKDWKDNVILIVGGIVIFISCLLFFTLTSDRTAIQWVSFLFILYAENAATVSLFFMRRLTSKADKTMVIVGFSTIIMIYTAISLIISLIFITDIFESIASLITIQVLLFALAAIVAVVYFTFTKMASDKDKSILQAISIVKQNCDDISVLMNDSKNIEYRNKLEKIYESIKFCNNSVSVPSDDKIAQKIIELDYLLGNESDATKGKVEDILNEIIVLTKKRELEAQNAVRGGV